MLSCGFMINGQVIGRVMDAETEAALANVVVILKNYDRGVGGVLDSTLSDHFGYFQFDTVGIFLILCSHVGYTPQTILSPLSGSNARIWMSPGFNELSEVQVNASLLGVKLRNVVGANDVISKVDLAKTKSISISSNLNTLPGVQMQQGTYSTNRLVIRGMGSRNPYGSNRIKAYLDDIPITNGDGSTTLEDIDPGLLSRVEIVKGPSAALYGAGLGGTIRMYSPNWSDLGTSVQIHSLAGRFGLFKNGIKASSATTNADVWANFSNTFSKGYRDNNRYVRNHAMLKTHRYTSGGKWTFLVNYSGIDAQIPSSLDSTTFTTNPQAAAANWKAVKGFEKYHKVLSGVNLEKGIGKYWENYSTLYGAFYDGYESRPFNILDDDGNRFGLRQRFSYFKKDLRLTAGFEYFREYYQWQVFKTNGGEAGNVLSKNKERRTYINAFALGNYQMNTRWKLDFGLNLNYLHYNLSDLGPGLVDNSGSYNYQAIFSPRLGAICRVHKNHNIYISASHGFSPPSVEEALYPDGEVNLDLQPEEGVSFDVGSRGQFGDRFNYDLGMFFMLVKNMLVTKRLSEDEFMGINAGKTHHVGVELKTKWQVIPQTEYKSALTIHMDWSQHKFEDFIDDGVDYGGNSLPGIPLGSVFMGWHGDLPRKFSYDLMWYLNGKQYMNDANTKDYPAHHYLNFKANYNMGKHKVKAQLEIGIDNVYNTQYASMILVNAPAFGGKAPRYYYPATPRNYYVGIKLNM